MRGILYLWDDSANYQLKPMKYVDRTDVSSILGYKALSKNVNL